MLPFFGNNSILIIGNMEPATPELGVVITEVGIDVLSYENSPQLITSTLVVDALLYPDPTNKLYISSLLTDTLAHNQPRHDLFCSTLCVDILRSNAL